MHFVCYLKKMNVLVGSPSDIITTLPNIKHKLTNLHLPNLKLR